MPTANSRQRLKITLRQGRTQVESLYDFEPFTKNYITEIPLAKDFILKLPDGLSHYLTKIAVAKNFKYTSGWIEAWK